MFNTIQTFGKLYDIINFNIHKELTIAEQLLNCPYSYELPLQF